MTAKADEIIARIKTQRGEQHKTDAEDAHPPPLSFTIIDLAYFDDHEIPQRDWTVNDRFPCHQVVVLSGEGDVGKSILLMQLAAAHPLGRDWLQALVKPGPVVLINAEDEAIELARRFKPIAEHYGVTFTELQASGLNAISLAGEDAVLAAPIRGTIQPTPRFKLLRELVLDIRPVNVVLDNVADVFAGDEIDRVHVRAFLSMLRRLAIDADTTVTLAAHPSLTGIRTGTGLSGSTHWHNGTRARAYFTRCKTEDGQEPDQDLREIQFLKNNYGPRAATLQLRWRNGLFLPEAAAGSLEKLAQEQKADDVFLTLLTKLNARGEKISNQRKAHMYAPAVLAKEPEAKAARFKKKDLEAAMNRLLDADKVHREQYGSPSRDTFKLVIGEQPK
jgi:RecA-family ATPase